ncbi:hypothetical protein BGZ94_005990 [Podila epigama]|nr:hypothetical protein BGZ94_005990 [Podila epigama]
MALQKDCQKAGGACINSVGVYEVRTPLQVRGVMAIHLIRFCSILKDMAPRAERSWFGEVCDRIRGLVGSRNICAQCLVLMRRFNKLTMMSASGGAAERQVLDETKTECMTLGRGVDETEASLIFRQFCGL